MRERRGSRAPAASRGRGRLAPGPESSGPGNRQPIGVGALLAAWVLTIAVDLLFNAGILSPLFDQAREPGLLPDAELFRRIPVAYAALGVAVLALAWLVRRADAHTIIHGATLGAAAGAVAAALGIVSLWTAIDMTGAFVTLGALVQVAQLTAGGAVLGAMRGTAHPRRIAVRAYAVAVGAVVLAVLAQNALGTWSG